MRHECGPDTCGFATFEERMAIRDELDPIPWHTEQDVREAAARMKAWTEVQADVLGDARWCDLTDAEWLNLARVALEMNPR